MDAWILVGYWLLALLGLLWVKRSTRGKLRCNIFSAAIAAAMFVGIAYGFTYVTLILSQQASGAIQLVYFLFLAIGLIPVSSALTLFLGTMLVPFFKVKTSDIRFCTTYLTAWTFVALSIISMLNLLGFLLMGLFFGSGIPRTTMKRFDDEHYYY